MNYKILSITGWTGNQIFLNIIIIFDLYHFYNTKHHFQSLIIVGLHDNHHQIILKLYFQTAVVLEIKYLILK